MLDFSESGECRQKLLMDLPDTARLISNGYEIAPQSTYLIDRESNVYIYLDELKAAVESEYAYACDENGDQIVFSVQEVHGGGAGTVINDLDQAFGHAYSGKRDAIRKKTASLFGFI